MEDKALLNKRVGKGEESLERVQLILPEQDSFFGIRYGILSLKKFAILIVFGG